jgi:hypothetical protein
MRLLDKRSWRPRAAIFISALVFEGCLSSTTPHENFRKNLLTVGGDIRNRNDYPRYERVNLANGNVEYRLTRRYPPGKGLCTTIYEVDPKTFKILRADFLGSPDDCVLQP